MLHISYPVYDYVQVCEHVAPQLGADWQGHFYHFPRALGQGAVEAWSFEGGSMMLARYQSLDFIRVERLPSQLKDHLLLDFVLSGHSAHFKHATTPFVPTLQFGFNISTPSTGSYGDFPPGVEHIHLCLLVSAEWIRNRASCTVPAIFGDMANPVFSSFSVPESLLLPLQNLLKADLNMPLRGLFFEGKWQEITALSLQYLWENPGPNIQESWHPDDLFALQGLVFHIQENLGGDLRMEALIELVPFGKDKLQKMFQSVYGKSVGEFIRLLKMQWAHTALKNGKTVSEVGYALGYTNLSHFARAFRQIHHYPPSRVGKRLPGAQSSNGAKLAHI